VAIELHNTWPVVLFVRGFLSFLFQERHSLSPGSKISNPINISNNNVSIDRISTDGGRNRWPDGSLMRVRVRSDDLLCSVVFALSLSLTATIILVRLQNSNWVAKQSKAKQKETRNHSFLHPPTCKRPKPWLPLTSVE